MATSEGRLEKQQKHSGSKKHIQKKRMKGRMAFMTVTTLEDANVSYPPTANNTNQSAGSVFVVYLSLATIICLQKVIKKCQHLHLE